MIGLIIAAAFQFRFMTLAIDVIDRRGPRNEMRRQLQPKILRQGCISCLYNSKTFYPPFITKKTEHFSFISGCVMRVENGGMHRQL